MKGKRRFLSILMVLAFVVALPAISVWGAQDPDSETIDTTWVNDDFGINSSEPILYLYDPSGVNWWLKGYHGISPNWFEIYDYTNNRRIFTIEAAAPSDSIFIEQDGDVGFQTQSPSYALDIQTSSPDLRLLRTSDSISIFYVTSSGQTTAYANYDALRGYSNATTGDYWGVYGRSLSPDGEGVYATNSATTGLAHGVYASTYSSSGRALEAYAGHTTGSVYGVYASTPSTSGRAIQGNATATSGGAYGVVGSANSTTGGVGVLGGGGVFGVWGLTGYSGGSGVVGLGSNSTGANYGVQGISYSASGKGVAGTVTHSSGTVYGVFGTASSTLGRGVYGNVSAPTGITYGVAGVNASSSGRGVFGYANASSGLTYGVAGRSDSPEGRGLSGYNAALTGSSAGIYGDVRSPQGWAGKFITPYGNGIYVSVPAGKVGLTVASGTKNAVVPTADGSRLLYTEESTEVWFSDYGFGQLEKGVAVVQIDPVFAQTVNLQQSYHVFLEEYGPEELYVSQRTPTSFEVRAVKGKPDVEFSYRLVAKRLGHEARRLEDASWADGDPNLYPQIQADWEAMHALPEDMMGPPPEVSLPEITAVDLSAEPSVQSDSDKPVEEMPAEEQP